MQLTEERSVYLVRKRAYMHVRYAHVTPEHVTTKRPQNPRIMHLTLKILASRIKALYSFPDRHRDF